MDEKIETYCNARDYLYSSVGMKVKTFMTSGIDDPLLNFQIIKHTTEMVKAELIHEFPDIPEDDLPQCRFRIHEDTREIEVGIQYYYNHTNGLVYLGTSEIEDEIFDCYYRRSFDPRFEYRFFVVFGHEKDNITSGSKTAEAEYYLGQLTPLSVTYALAKEQGFLC